MKSRSLLLASALCIASTSVSHAAVQYFAWDAARTSWTSNFWGGGSGGPFTSAWGGYNDAILGVTGGTVSGGIVSGGSVVNKWTFNADGYILTGGFTMGSPAVANLIVPNAAHTATISGNLGIANTGNILWKDGAGKIVLGGTNSPYKLYAEQGTLEINAGTTTVTSDLHVGIDSFGTATTKTGTLAVSGGSLTVNGANFMMGQTINGTTKVGQFTQTGGTVTFSGSFMGIANGGGVSQLNLSGGSFISAATMALGVRNNATLNLSGSAAVNVPDVRIFWADAVTGTGKTGTINLDGGTLTVGGIWQASGANTSIVNFNGGTLKARSSNGGFLGGLTSAKVKAGGANIDSDSFTITISQPLIEDATSPGGGLTKSGTGVLALNGTHGFTGPTTVNAGTLLINGSLPAATTVSVAAGAALGGNGTVPGPVNSLGNIVPGNNGIGTLTTGPTQLTGATYICQIQGSGADCWNVTGDLVLTDATLQIQKLSTATFTTAVIASYTGTLTGAFTIASPLPAGISVHHDEANKQIYLVKAGDYDTWLEAFSFANGSDTSIAEDTDGDGLSNRQEYAFGLDPANSSSNQPVISLPDRTTGTFTYRRRNPALTGMGYKVWTSTDLSNWTEDTGAMESVTNVGENQDVLVNLSLPVPFTPPTLFVRCTATEGAGSPPPSVLSSTAISSSHYLPVVGQDVQIGLPTGGAGLCMITDPTGVVSRLDIPASGTATWQPSHYGKYTLQCPGYVRTIRVMATPMHFSWWDVRWSPGIENATAVMAIPTGSETEWQRRGTKIVSWAVGEYAHRTGVGYNPPYSVADQWVQDWLRSKALPQHQQHSGFALDEIFCSSDAPSPAIAEAIYNFRQQVGPDYFISVYTAGAVPSFGPYAHFLRDSNALCMIESYYGDEALFAARWNDMKIHGLANQTVFAIGCGFRLNATTHGPLTPQEARDEFAKVRRVAPESPGITMYGGFSVEDRTTIQPAIDAACSLAVEDYFLKPVIHLTGGKTQAVCWNIGNDDANGFIIEWHGSSGKIGEQVVPKLTPQQKLTISSIAGATKAVVRPAPSCVNIQPAGVTITP